MTNTVQEYHHFCFFVASDININQNYYQRQIIIVMKKYVHKLSTDGLNLSCVGTLSPQVSNYNFIAISGSWLELNLTKTDIKQYIAYIIYATAWKV